MTFLLHNADGGLNCEAKLCVSLVQSRSCYYITDKSDTSFICPNTVQDITVSPVSQLLHRAPWGYLWPHQYCLWNCAQSMQSKHPCKTWELWFTFLTCCLSAVLLLQLSLCAGLISCDVTQRFQFSIKRAKAWINSHHASDFQLWAENFHIIARNPPIWSCRSGISCHRIPPKNVKTALNLHPPQVESKRRLTLKKMRLMWFYACLCGSWLSQVVCGISF